MYTIQPGKLALSKQLGRVARSKVSANRVQIPWQPIGRICPINMPRLACAKANSNPGISGQTLAGTRRKAGALAPDCSIKEVSCSVFYKYLTMFLFKVLSPKAGTAESWSLHLCTFNVMHLFIYLFCIENWWPNSTETERQKIGEHEMITNVAWYNCRRLHNTTGKLRWRATMLFTAVES